jgi:putative ABC transport system substrate-binding protein
MDPVQYGLAASLEKPGGNATGLYYADAPGGKASLAQQELLRLLNPQIGSPFMTLQIMDASADAWRTDAQAALANLGQNVRTRRAPVPDDIKALLQTDPAAALRQMQERMGPATTPTTPDRMQSLQIYSGPFLDSGRRKDTVALAARHGIPTIYQWRGFVEAGGLMSYGLSIEDMYVQIGRYAGAILKGSNPAEMPIVTPTRYETVINLQAAAELGLAIPPALLARVDKVIQ